MKHAWMIASFALAGCVSTDTQMIDSRTAMISAGGSAFDSSAGVIKKVMQQAARKATERGYQYFVILDGKTGTSTSYYNPGSTNTTSGTVNCTTNFCNYNSTTNYGGSSAVPIDKPTAEVMVRFYREGEQPEGAISVAEVLAEK